MAAGEELFASRGISQVALDEIARHAGKKDKYAVQYHFGGRSGLVQAILNTRFEQIDAHRLQSLRQQTAISREALIAAYIWPIAEQVDTQGNCSFAHFLAQFGIKADLMADVQHPAESNQASGTMLMFRALHATIPAMDEQALGRRLQLLMHVPLAMLAGKPLRTIRRNQEEFLDMVRMLEAALTCDLG